jgi:hypothetical protein
MAKHRITLNLTSPKDQLPPSGVTILAWWHDACRECYRCGQIWLGADSFNRTDAPIYWCNMPTPRDVK